jgi:hypothetical protein
LSWHALIESQTLKDEPSSLSRGLVIKINEASQAIETLGLHAIKPHEHDGLILPLLQQAIDRPPFQTTPFFTHVVTTMYPYN